MQEIMKYCLAINGVDEVASSTQDAAAPEIYVRGQQFCRVYKELIGMEKGMHLLEPTPRCKIKTQALCRRMAGFLTVALPLSLHYAQTLLKQRIPSFFSSTNHPFLMAFPRLSDAAMVLSRSVTQQDLIYILEVFPLQSDTVY